MALGILSDPRARGRRPRRAMAGATLKCGQPGYAGLGALGATIPANCWDTPGFKQCNTDAWKIAQRKCITEGLAQKQYGGDWETCQNVQAADASYFGCALRLCPPPLPTRPTSSGGWTWKNQTPNASVKAFQDHINQAITQQGYKPIVADGRLGPATCGAFNFVDMKRFGALFANDPIQNIGICQSFTNPTKIGSSTPEKSPTNADAQMMDAKYAGLPWLKPDPRVAQLQQEINRQLASNDYLPIAVTGMLDPPTCGAMHELDEISGSHWIASWGPIGIPDCPSIVRPTKKPEALPPLVVTASPPVAPGPAAPAPTEVAKTGLSAGSILGGGLLAAAMVGGYVWWKKKTGGA